MSTMNKMILSPMLLLSFASQAHAVAQTPPFTNAIYASYAFPTDNDYGFTIRDASNLSSEFKFISTNPNTGPITSLSFSNNVIYLTSGNTISKYNTNGDLINSFSFSNPDYLGVTYTSVTTNNNNLFATYVATYAEEINGQTVTRQAYGISVRNLNTLEQISDDAIDTGSIKPTSIIANNNSIYFTSGNSIYRYNTDGTFADKFTFDDEGVNYTNISIVNGKLYVAYTTKDPLYPSGVTIRNLSTLEQESVIDTPYSTINGITAGNNNDFFITSGDNIFQYSVDGTFKESFTFNASDMSYGALAVSPVPEPEMLSMLALGLVLTVSATQRYKRKI